MLRYLAPAARIARIRPSTVVSLQNTAFRPISTSSLVLKKASKGNKNVSSKSAKSNSSNAQQEPLTEEDPSEVLPKLEAQLKESLEAFKRKTAETKQGQANPRIFDNLQVPLNHKESYEFTSVAQTALKGRNLIVTVFDPNNVKHVVSAVLASGLNLNPQSVPNFPQQLKVPLPPPTGEHRREIAKELKNDFEHFKASKSKHSLATARADALKELKSFVKNDAVKKITNEVEKLHKKYNEELQKQFKAAEKTVLG